MFYFNALIDNNRIEYEMNHAHIAVYCKYLLLTFVLNFFCFCWRSNPFDLFCLLDCIKSVEVFSDFALDKWLPSNWPLVVDMVLVSSSILTLYSTSGMCREFKILLLFFRVINENVLKRVVYTLYKIWHPYLSSPTRAFCPRRFIFEPNMWLIWVTPSSLY